MLLFNKNMLVTYLLIMAFFFTNFNSYSGSESPSLSSLFSLLSNFCASTVKVDVAFTFTYLFETSVKFDTYINYVHFTF